MANESRESYLESKVLTAPSHKLHLMLIESAIRFGRQARQALVASDPDAARQSLTRAIHIATELLAGVKGQESEVNKKLVNLYAFVTGQLADAWYENDLRRLEDALSVLEYERETWQLVCEQQDASDAGETDSSRAASVDHSHTPPLKIYKPTGRHMTSLSFEA